MNKKNVNALPVLLLAGCVSFFTCFNALHAAPNEKLDWIVEHPIKSNEVDIDVSMDKNSYIPGEIPRISISGYNKTNIPKVMNVLLGVFGPDGTEYAYPSWKVNASQPWLQAYTIPQNYQLSSTFLTTMEDVPELTLGKWYVSAILQDPSSGNVVSLKVYPFIIGKSTSPIINNPAPSTSAPLDGMLGIWSIVDWGLYYLAGVPQSGSVDNYVMIFEDGTMTYDMGTILNEGIEISKTRNAKRWGNWRVTDKGGEYRWSNWSDPKYDDPISVYQVEPGTTDQRLDKCFGRIIGVDAGLDRGDVSSTVASGYCFKLNGSFSHSAGVSSSSDAHSFTSNTKESGQYRIDGNFITFTYGDGVVRKAAFGFLNKEHTHIMINIKRLISWGEN
jgi:hypothetical protein